MRNGARNGLVLVVDDEPQVLAAIEDTLESEYRVVLETSPRAALRVVEKEPQLSVILSDQRMPGMSGDEFLARAQAVSDASRLMITGYADLEAVIKAVNNGHIFGYISKPWDPRALKLMVFKASEHYRLLRELSAEQRLLHNLMDNVPDAIFFKDREHRFLRVNRAHARRLGLERPEQAVGRATREFFTPEEARDRELEDEEVMRSETPLADKVRRIILPGGRLRWVSTTKAAIRDEKGRAIGLVGIARDITEREQAEERIRRLSRVYAVLSGINSLIVRVGEREQLYKEACRIATELGRFPAAWIGELDRSAMRVKPVAWQGIDEALLGEICMTAREDAPEGTGPVGRAVRERVPFISNDIEKDPQLRANRAMIAVNARSLVVLPLVVDGEAMGVLVLYADVVGFFDDEEMRLLRELAGDISFALDHIGKTKRLDYLVYFDSLTGLANRTLFHERLGQSLSGAEPGARRIGVAVWDIERFKTINDTFGRQAGDALLNQIAERLRRQAGDEHRIARIESDHFAIAIPNSDTATDLARRLEVLMDQIFGAPFQVGNTELRTAAKAGIAVFPDDGRDVVTLFMNAEAALKRAKRIGERYVFYAPEMTARVAERLSLENKLRRAIEKEEFVLHYQPQLDLETRKIVGVEALIRWQSPELGLVPPGQFVPLLEETGLILPVGNWALKQASLDHRSWTERKLQPPRVAVNVSALQLRQRDFVSTVEHAIMEGVAPIGIDLEITESLVMQDIDANIEKLNALRALGVRISIDDFGTGYSSLAYLAKLPVEALKIDRVFISTMLEDPKVATLVQTIISTAHTLRLKAVAEGVETEEQAKILRLLRCDQAQGYLFSPPVSAERLEGMLKAL